MVVAYTVTKRSNVKKVAAEEGTLDRGDHGKPIRYAFLLLQRSGDMEMKPLASLNGIDAGLGGAGLGWRPRSVPLIQSNQLSYLMCRAVRSVTMIAAGRFGDSESFHIFWLDSGSISGL
jgi:hypothetical protein